MDLDLHWMYYTAGFAIVVIASFRIGELFQKIRLPLITGFLLTGLAAGPFALALEQTEGIIYLDYLNDFSLAFIAFAAGSELYLKDMGGIFKSIAWNTAGQLVITFTLSTLALFFLGSYIPFMAEMTAGTRLAVSMLAGTIFVARSPASAIAIINEMRAKGPFTQTALGVTVVKDVLVIILFAIIFSISETLVRDMPFSAGFILVLAGELAASFLLAFVLGKILSQLLRIGAGIPVKAALLLLIGFGVYVLSHQIQHYTAHHWSFDVHLEPLLICIIASFYVTNYTAQRGVFHRVLEAIGPYVYVTFFTLTGAAMSLDILVKVWGIALILFFVRLISMVIAGYVGGSLAGDPKKFRAINWMPYVTQAGVGLGLAIIIQDAYPGWGNEFATIIIGVIVLNQIIGPPLFKWAIQHAGESHVGMPTPEFDGVRDAIIFGTSSEALALARQLQSHHWLVKVVTLLPDIEDKDTDGLNIYYLPELTGEALVALDTEQAEAIVAMMVDDEENLRICELAYEFLGTKDLIVVLNVTSNYAAFTEFGAKVVHPATAMISLLDHLVRSPLATQMLLGMEEGQDTIEVEVQDESLFGILLRDLKLPSDVIVMSLRRGDQVLLPHGYTRLRPHDYLTFIGSVESLDEVELRFGI